MAETEMFTLRIPSGLVKQVDEFWHTQTLRSRTAAMIRLMEDGLKSQALLERQQAPAYLEAVAATDSELDSWTYLCACLYASGQPTREMMDSFKRRNPPAELWMELLSELTHMWGAEHMESVL